MDPIGAAHSIQLFHKPCSEDVTLRKPRISDKNSKNLLTTILLLLSFFFATYNYSLTRGRMGGWWVPWTPQRGKNRFKAPLFQCKSFALKKYSSLKISPQPTRRAGMSALLRDICLCFGQSKLGTDFYCLCGLQKSSSN